MNLDHQGPRKSAGRIGSIVLKALIVIIAMALPLSAGAPGSWTISASLNTARANHAAAMLPNGQALIVGGTGSSGKPLTSAEIFSLSSNSFTTLPTGLAVGVSGLTATVLNDNTVLLAGGLNSSGKSVNAAELYDPSTSGFIKLPMMKIARSHHTATLLADGRVLIAGGLYTTAPIANVEIFDPATRAFTVASPLKHARMDHTATLLADGTVLIAGGAGSAGPLSTAEIFNPVTGKVTQTGSLSQARTRATASMLYNFDGTVLVEGGQGAGGVDLNTAEEYDPATGAFSTLAAHMNTARSGHTGVTLPYNGKVLIAGGTSAGQPVTDNEVYDPITATFAANEPMSVAREEFAANFFAIPAVGQVLMSGGLDDTGNPLALTEMYTYPTIRTDKSDYPPGSPVTITGAGWAPGETVTIQIQETDSDDTWLSDTADSTGSFTDTSFQIQDNDGGVKFVMTATGATSGETAQYKFTDSLHVASVSVGAQSPSAVNPPPGSATYSIILTVNGGGGGTVTGVLSVSGLPTGVTTTGSGFTPSNSVSCNGTTICNGSHVDATLTLNVAGTVANGLYTFTVTSTGGSSGNVTGSGTLQVGPPVVVTGVTVSAQSPATVTAGAAAGFTIGFTHTGAGTEPSAALSVLSSQIGRAHV